MALYRRQTRPGKSHKRPRFDDRPYHASRAFGLYARSRKQERVLESRALDRRPPRKKLALPGWITWRQYPDVVDRLSKVVATFGSPAPEREIEWSQEAKKQWCKFYDSINTSNAGVVGSIIARSDAHVLRLTMLFTVLENSTLMEPRHLNAAIAFWQYCERSAMWAFGEKTGNKAADQIYWALQREPKGMTRAQINLEVFNNHASKSQMDFAFSTLVDARLVCFKFERDKGAKPTQRWFIKKPGSNLAI